MVSSCAYDPLAYNATGSATASFPVSSASSGGYYDAYNNYDVAVPASIGLTLVATRSRYWGYDPYRRSYYDYRRSCYYDPWLNCYYPRGYCPRPVYGVPHPYGWRPGHSVCPYPRHPAQRWANNRYDRLRQMKASHYAWAQKVRYNRQSWAAHMRQYPQAWQYRLQPRSRRNQHANRPPSPARPMAGRRSGANPRQNISRGKKSGGWFNTPVSAPAPGAHPSAPVNRPRISGRPAAARQRLKTANQQAIARQKARQDALRQRIQSARPSRRPARTRVPYPAQTRRSVQPRSRRTPRSQPASPRIPVRTASRAARKSTAAAPAKAAKARRRAPNR